MNPATILRISFLLILCSAFVTARPQFQIPNGDKMDNESSRVFNGFNFGTYFLNADEIESTSSSSEEDEGFDSDEDLFTQLISAASNLNPESRSRWTRFRDRYIRPNLPQIGLAAIRAAGK